MAPKVVPLIPSHMLYCEPFAGGLAVLFAKGSPLVTNDDYYHEIINDKDERLINMYRVFQTRFPEMLQRLSFTPMSESEHKRAKEILKDETASEIDRAWAYYVSINQSFSNILNVGWQRTNKVPARNMASVWKSSIDRLSDCFERLRNVQIACTDAIKCIEQFDSKDAFFYCDPPYPETDQGHYKGYTVADFQRLVDCLAEIKGQFILSNYNQPGITFPESWRKVEIEAAMSAAGGGKGGSRIEALWMSKEREAAIGGQVSLMSFAND